MACDVISSEISRLRRRANLYRMQSYAILMIIVATIGGGSYLFYFATQLDESTVAAMSNTLSTATGNISSDSERVRQLLADREVSINAASRAVSGATLELQKQTRDIAAKFQGLQAQIDEIKSNVDSAQALDTEGLQQLIDKQLGEASTEYLTNVRAIESRLRSIWRTRTFPIPEGCEVKNQFAKGDKTAIFCKLPVSKETASSLSHCIRNSYNGVLGKAELFQCGQSTAEFPGFANLILRIDPPVVYLNSIKEEIAQAKFEKASVNLDIQSEIDQYTQQIQILNGGIESILNDSIESIPEIDANILDQFAVVATELQKTSLSFDNVSKSIGEKGVEWYTFLEKITIRITVVVLIIFLVQILVNLFRYGTRLASFYDGRADALTLIQASNQPITSAAFGNLVMTMAPDSVDFGKSPKSPMDSAVELSRQILAVGKKAP